MSNKQRFKSAGGLDASALTIINVAAPVNPTDAANMAAYQAADAAIVAGNVASATTAVTVTGAAQPAITSVGTLTSLTVTAPISGSITGNAATANTASTVATNANLTGDVTSVGNATTLTNAAVINKVLTGYVSGAGVVVATDTILGAIQKLNGNQVAITNSLQGAMVYQGAWNASTNVPALASGVGTKGFYYKATTAGTTLIDGNSQWNIGDMIAYNGTTWDKFDGVSTEVTTVVGQVGAVTAAQIATALNGLNFNIAGAAATASTVTNPAQAAITSVGTLTGLTVTAPIVGSITGNAATVTTNANLTGDVTSVGNATTLPAATVLGKALVGFNSTTGTITAADTVLTAIEKLNGNLALASTATVLTLANGSLTSDTFTSSTTAANQIVDSIALTSARTVKYLIQVTSGTGYQACELLVIQDGTNAWLTEYGDINTGAVLATFDATITGGNLNLVCTPTNAVTVVKVVRTSVNV